jgi:Zn-dependent M28 family amino/carboxypeptidase
VLGYIEGTDKKDEVLVICGHYDHEGIKKGEVYNGADDNGSGTVGLLELAQAFSLAKADGNGPRRSLLFISLTGEEKGLLGSKYYARNPIFPLSNTVAALNIDMLGRIDKEHAKDSSYIYTIGSDYMSAELHKISEECDKTYTPDLKIDYKYNDKNEPERLYYRSDQISFAEKGVPVIFYFSGLHPDYHTPADDVDKISFKILEKRLQLVFATAWELANRDERVMVDKK